MGEDEDGSGRPGDTVAAVAPSSPAVGQTPASNAVTVVARGLDRPYSLQFTGKRSLVVTEGDAGAVTAVNTATGTQRTLLERLSGPAGVGVRNGRLHVALGESHPDVPPTASRPALRGATVVTAGAAARERTHPRSPCRRA